MDAGEGTAPPPVEGAVGAEDPTAAKPNSSIDYSGAAIREAADKGACVRLQAPCVRACERLHACEGLPCVQAGWVLLLLAS